MSCRIELGALAKGRRSTKRREVSAVVAACLLLGASPSAVRAAGDETATSAEDTSTKALLKKLEAMERRIKVLEGQLKEKQSVPAAHAAKPPPSPSPAPANATAARAQTQAQAQAQSAPPPEPVANGRKPILGVLDSPLPGLVIGAYGEVKFGMFQNPAANGQWQNGFDLHRMGLLPAYQITENIIFNAEIEVEHRGLAFGSRAQR